MTKNGFRHISRCLSCAIDASLLKMCLNLDAVQKSFKCSRGEVHRILATTLRNAPARLSREKQVITENVQDTLSPEDEIDDVTREVHENDSDD